MRQNASPNVVKVLAGNKSDAEFQRVVERANGEKVKHAKSSRFNL